MADSPEEIVVCTGEVTKVEKVPMRNGVAPHNETLIEFDTDSKLFLPNNGYSNPTAIKTLLMQTELKFGKKYEVILREVKPKTAHKENARLIRAGEST
jgi:hypothetical protein